MVTAGRDEIQRKLAERVARRVQGRGISRASVDAAVGGVLDALPDAVVAPSGSAGAGEASAHGSILVAITARSLPDLGSRLRAALTKVGVEPGPIGLAAAGNHHVATFRIPAAAREAAAKAAATVGAAMTVVPEGEA